MNSLGEPYKLVSTVFKDAVDRAKIENFHFHDLRHTFASRLVMAGVDLRTIQALMGHKSINMTLRYAHLAPEHLKKAVEVLDTLKSHDNFHDTPLLREAKKQAKLLNSQPWRRKVPGGAAGLQNQSGGRKVPGGFDSLPSPPKKFCRSADGFVLGSSYNQRRRARKRSAGWRPCGRAHCRSGRMIFRFGENADCLAKVVNPSPTSETLSKLRTLTKKAEPLAPPFFTASSKSSN